MSLKKYIAEAEARMHRPDVGDTFAIELEDGTLLETYIMAMEDNAILLDATDRMVSVLAEWNYIGDEAGDVLLEDESLDKAQQLDEFLPALGALAGRALAGSAGAGALGRMAASAAGNVLGSALTKDKDEELDEDEYQDEQSVAHQDSGEYDYEGDMAKDDLYTIIRAARKLNGMLDDDENLPEWVQSKINKAADYVDTAADYIESNKERAGEQDMAEGQSGNDIRVYGNRQGYYVWTPTSPLLAITSDGQYQMDWPDMAGNEKKALQMVSQMGMKPVDFSTLPDNAKRTIGRKLFNQGVAEGSEDLRAKLDLYNEKAFEAGHRHDDQAWRKYTKLAKQIADQLGLKYKVTGYGLEILEQGVAEGVKTSAWSYTHDDGSKYRVTKTGGGYFATVVRDRQKYNIPFVDIGGRPLGYTFGSVEDAVNQIYNNIIRSPSNMSVTAPEDFLQKGYRQQGVAEGEDDLVDLGPALHNLTGEFNKFMKHDDRMKTDPAYAKKWNKRYAKYAGNDDHSIYDDPDDEVTEGTKTGNPVILKGCDFEDVVNWLVKNVGPVTRKSPNYYNGWEGKGWMLNLLQSSNEDGIPNLELSADTKLANNQMLVKTIQMACSGQQGVAEGEMAEAKYQGREVPLGKPMRGDVKKFKVYVRDPKSGNVKKVNFGHGGTSAKRAGQKTMSIKKSDPARRRSFRARHNCDNPGPRTKARYWSCRKW